MFPAALSFSAALCVTVVFAAWRIARAPRWAQERELARSAAFAFVYNIVSLLDAEKVGSVLAVALAHIAIVSAALTLYFWSRYELGVFRRAPNTLDRWMERALLATAAAGAIPRLLYGSDFVIRRVEWAGLSVANVDTTWLGELGYAVLLLSVLRLLWRSILAAGEKQPGGLMQAFGMSVLFLTGVSDIATSLDWVTAPMLSSLGFMAPVLAAAVVLTRRFATDAQSLDELRTRLEAVVEDRTRELAKTQEKLRNEETLAALGRVAAGVAHEINNPSAAIAANLRYIEEMVVEGREIPPDLGEAVSDSQDAIRRISQIVKQLLSSGHGKKAVIRPVDVETVARRVVRTASASLRPGIRLEVDVPASCAVAANEDLLEQAMLNLVVNGVQAIPTSREGRVKICASVDAERVTIVVEDDGPGIPVSLRDRIFEPFFTTKEPGAGTGLGLPVSRGLMRSMDGELRVESSEPGRTCFVVELPRAP